MFKMSPLCVNTISRTLSALAGSSVNNVLLQSVPDFNRPLFGFFHVIDATPVHTLLHAASNLAVNWVRVRAV